MTVSQDDHHTDIHVHPPAPAGSGPRSAVTASGGTSNRSNDGWLAPAVLVLVAVGLYVRYLERALVVATGLTAFTVCIIAGALVSSRVRGVRLPTRFSVALVSTGLASVSGVVDIWFLRDPPLSPHRATYRQLLAAVGQRGVFSVGADDFGFLAYQVLGLALTVTMLILSMQLGTGVLAVINAAQRARPERLWRRLATWGQAPGLPAVVIVVLAIIAMLLSSGTGWTLVDRYSSVQLPGSGTPSTTRLGRSEDVVPTLLP